MYLLQIEWDPIKFIDLGFFKLHFYSLMWIIAFVIGFYTMKPIFKKEGESKDALDALFIYSVLGIMLGARLGHVIFYEPELFKEDFFSIFLPFSFKDGIRFTGFQGLASHGAAIAMIISMYLYRKKHLLHRSWLWILDRVVIPVALGAVFVRIGNFINSEIVGFKTDSPLGVIFVQNGENFARHPAQLYEAFFYIFVFIGLLFFYWRTNKSKQEGFLFGLFLVLLWTIRFFVEFVKKAQVDGRDDYVWFMNTGQVLSVPLILIGLYFMFFYKKKAE
ncbi:MAG: prolipoprotein diacylglyceryl transferase [Winogradskyella sp.]|uniref:prolipoprotein diacylglyceryl transferase n=1 Tax=Winogradskyella sp. TaxID=1883156 RepID=UPI0025D594B7|nr:prolipoprotein diacylglyceryl transferase [Winogradskyella sp.]NRB83181.1 prolipoprotein diacylglyceryl transferase [Winogradskyella sp.]